MTTQEDLSKEYRAELARVREAIVVMDGQVENANDHELLVVIATYLSTISKRILNLETLLLGQFDQLADVISLGRVQVDASGSDVSIS